MDSMERMKIFMVIAILPVCLMLHTQQDIHQAGHYTNQDKHAAAELDPVYLLLGTLSDYMGRLTYVDKEHQVDYYHYYEEPLVRYLDSLILAELKIDVSETFINGRYDTFSEELSEMINSYYRDGMIYSSLFKTRCDICSFLTGRYYRYGEQLNDSIFKIQVQNSPNHMLIDTLLSKMECTDIMFRHYNTLPAQFIYYFVPTPELKSCFMLISSRKKDLDDEYRTAARRILGSGKDYDELVKIKNDRDLIRVIEHFREN